MTPRRSLLGATLLGALASCVPAAFSPHARDNVAADLSRALAPASAASDGRAIHGAANGRALVYAVTAPPRQLIGWDLAAGRAAFRIAADVRSRVEVGPGLIAEREGATALVGRDPLDGHVRFRCSLRPGETFIGATIGAGRLYYVAEERTRPASAAVRSVLVAVDADGKERWRRPAEGALGAPAARGARVAVPFEHQAVVILDGATGHELARLRDPESQISFVRALPEGFFYGGPTGVAPLALGSLGHRRTVKVARALAPFYFVDGYDPSQSTYGAFERRRYLWRDAAGPTLVHAYRDLFAFDPRSTRLRWAYAGLHGDLAASADLGRSIGVVEEDGAISLLDPRSGAARLVGNLGRRVKGATFAAEGIEAGPVGPPPPLADTLFSMAEDQDARLGPEKLLAAQLLGQVSGEEATRALLDLLLAPRDIDPAVAQAAGRALIARRDPSALARCLSALGVRYDFIAGTAPQRVGALAQIAAALGAHEAAPLIAAQLLDPQTPQSLLEALADALGALGGVEAAAAERELLCTYHADPSFLIDPGPLVVAGRALLAAGGPDGLRTVTYVADDPRTLPPLAAALHKMLVVVERAGQSKK